MMKSGTTLLISDMQGAFLEVGVVESLAGIEMPTADLEPTSDAWERFAEDIHQFNCAVHEYGQRSRPWLRQKKGRGAQ